MATLAARDAIAGSCRRGFDGVYRVPDAAATRISAGPRRVV